MPIRILRYPEIDAHPNPCRFHIKSLFTKVNIFAFCDQMPFGVHFKPHCTYPALFRWRQPMPIPPGCVLSSTARGSALVAFLNALRAPCPCQMMSLLPHKNAEAEPHPKPSSKHVENASLTTHFHHLKGGVHDPSLDASILLF